MKNKNILFIVVLCCLAILSACGSDSAQDPVSDNKVFVGEWITIYSTIDGTEAMVLTLSDSYTIKGLTYENVNESPVLYDRISGIWSYFTTNRIFSMIAYHSSTGLEDTESYLLKQVDDYSLILQSQETSMLLSFSKVLLTTNLQTGRSISLSSLGIPGDFKVTNLESSCPKIVSVEGNNLLSANGQGVAFITLYSATATAIAIINVK